MPSFLSSLSSLSSRFANRVSRKFQTLVVVLLVALPADQLSKFAVEATLAPWDRIEIVRGFLYVTHTRNPGAAFGLFAALQAADRGTIAQAILAIGRQDTEPTGLIPPPGLEIIGASSDHLILDTGDSHVSVGDEIIFQTNYTALLRSMTSPSVALSFTPETTNLAPPKEALAPVN